jgi:hypothetical protein
MRRLLCWLLGCRPICLYFRYWERDNYASSMSTGWQCLCCGKQWTEQWDDMRR